MRHVASDLLWDQAEQSRTAAVAVAIDRALRREQLMRDPIDLPFLSLEQLDTVLGQLDLHALGPLH